MPDLPILLATASADEINTHALMAAGISEVVDRPLISAETASALARCLAVSEIAVGDYDRNAFPHLWNDPVAQPVHPLRIDKRRGSDMRLQIAPARRALTGEAVRQMIGRCASTAVGAGFFAISISTFGADLGNGYSTAIAVPSQPAPAGRRPILAHPIDPPDAKPDRSAQRARIVDQLYEELMRSSGCSSATKVASIVGGC